jgi:hypothetical protein
MLLHIVVHTKMCLFENTRDIRPISENTDAKGAKTWTLHKENNAEQRERVFILRGEWRYSSTILDYDSTWNRNSAVQSVAYRCTD